MNSVNLHPLLCRASHPGTGADRRGADGRAAVVARGGIECDRRDEVLQDERSVVRVDLPIQRDVAHVMALEAHALPGYVFDHVSDRITDWRNLLDR